MAALVVVLFGPAALAGESCVIEGNFDGFVALEARGGIEFVRPVFSDVVDEGCTGEIAIVSPSPLGRLQLRGTPHFRVGRRYRVDLEAGASLGTHRISGLDEGVIDIGVATATRDDPGSSTLVGGPLLKPGNQAPPCTRNAWRPEAMPLVIEVHSAGSDDIDDGSDLEAVSRAAEAWGAPACSDALIGFAAPYDVPVPLAADGRNTFEFIEEGAGIFDNLDGSHVGFTCYVCDDEGWFVEADVRMNGELVSWSTDCTGDDWDVLGAAVHELGHVLGLPHVDDPEAVMFAVASRRRLLDSRSPANGDIDAVCELYPCPEGVDCGGAWNEEEACPAGAPLCRPCVASDECGAGVDACVTSAATGASMCARACSPSFPCPAGFTCANLLDVGTQCVLDEGSEACVDAGRFVGCACDEDGDCGGADDLCVEGRCAATCRGGVACPSESRCTVLRDPDGRVTAEQCLPDPDLPDPCAAKRRKDPGCCSVAGSADSGIVGPCIVAMAFAFERRRRGAGRQRP